MKFKILNRKVHYWLSIAIALPVLIVISTGLLLQLKKQLPWIQPAQQRGTGQVPVLTFSKLLDICQTVPEAGIRGWTDINRVDVRPGHGVTKVWAKNNWEIQVDSQSGKVLQVAYRRSDLIESLHDGSWFHPLAKAWIFLPAGIALLALWITGICLFAFPILARRRHRALEPRQPV